MVNYWDMSCKDLLSTYVDLVKTSIETERLSPWFQIDLSEAKERASKNSVTFAPVYATVIFIFSAVFL